MTKSAAVALCMLVMSLSGAGAQGLFYKHLTTGDGLPHNLCFHVNQDLHGTIWVCTDDGIARYEDGAFTRFGKEAGLASKYPIMAVNTPDSTQILAMWKGAICEFDGEKAWQIDTPTATRNSRSLNVALGSDSLIIIMKQGRADIFMCRAQRPYHITQYRIIPTQNTYALSPIEGLPPENSVTRNVSAFLNGKDVYFFQFDSGLWLLKPDNSLEQVWSNLLGKELVSAMAIAPDSSFWLGLSGQLVNIHKGKIRYAIALPDKEQIKRMLVSDDGNLVFSTFSRYATSSESLYWLKPDLKASIPISDLIPIASPVTEFSIDREQNLWIPTHGDGLFIVP
ncbi:MAG: hypothetical protein R3B47_18675 [Bacteroidia bacterium]